MARKESPPSDEDGRQEGREEGDEEMFVSGVFTPPGSSPQDGWPVFIFFHGGGWSYGDINAENSFSSHMCIDAACVVVSVAYRLAPENPYPAALDDAIEALQWVHNKGQGELGVNINKIAIGGSSSGGNLAAIAALKAPTFSPPIPLVLQLLIVPVIDNTASPTGEPHASWKENEHTVWLSPERMLWFRNNYLPNAEDYTKWDSSPIFAPSDLLAKAPKALILVAGLDILRDEGIAYGTKLTQVGVDARVKVYDKAPHQTMALDGVFKIGKQLVTDASTALKEAFQSS